MKVRFTPGRVVLFLLAAIFALLVGVISAWLVVEYGSAPPVIQPSPEVREWTP